MARGKRKPPPARRDLAWPRKTRACATVLEPWHAHHTPFIHPGRSRERASGASQITNYKRKARGKRNGVSGQRLGRGKGDRIYRMGVGHAELTRRFVHRLPRIHRGRSSRRGARKRNKQPSIETTASSRARLGLEKPPLPHPGAPGRLGSPIVNRRQILVGSVHPADYLLSHGSRRLLSLATRFPWADRRYLGTCLITTVQYHQFKGLQHVR